MLPLMSWHRLPIVGDEGTPLSLTTEEYIGVKRAFLWSIRTAHIDNIYGSVKLFDCSGEVRRQVLIDQKPHPHAAAPPGAAATTAADAGPQARDRRRSLRSYAGRPPIAVATETAGPFGESDASRAIQDMILAAWSRGVASNWTGFHHLEAVRPLLGIPANMDVLAVLPFGYPAQAAGAGKKRRKPLGEIASRERFGQLFA